MMNIDNLSVTETNPQASVPICMVKKIDKTTYRVRVYFNQASHETFQDKLMRVMKNELGGM